MADQATLQSQLTEAETALHQLVTGNKAFDTDVEGFGRVRYGETTVAALQAHVASLKSALKHPGARSRAIGVSF